jgi:two-component system LytT family response regulator
MKSEIKLPGLDHCPIQDIVYIEGRGNYSIVFLANKKQIVIAKTLKKFEAQFRLHSFIRIHKSYLINKDNIPAFKARECVEVPTSLGNSLPISRRKLELVRQSLG